MLPCMLAVTGDQIDDQRWLLLLCIGTWSTPVHILIAINLINHSTHAWRQRTNPHLVLRSTNRSYTHNEPVNRSRCLFSVDGHSRRENGLTYLND